jgi:LytS/YehU family sensor histidine kinase
VSPHGEQLRVSGSDTGIGFGRANTKGMGIGLINIRERLASLYGADASLEIGPNAPRGVIVSLTIPARQRQTNMKDIEI